MHLVSILYTCSMKELSSVTLQDIEGKTKKEFRYNAGYNSGAGTEDKLADTKVILYNSNQRGKIETELKRLGFKHVFSYKGNNNNVKTWMVKTKDLK